MTADQGKFTPENAARPRRRILTLATSGLIVAGALATGGGFIGTVKEGIDSGWSTTPAYRTVNDYEDTAVTLGKSGEISKLPQEFNSQEMSAAYKELDAENNRHYLDSGLLLSGMLLLGTGVFLSPIRRRRS